jgi:hypothetical protein
VSQGPTGDKTSARIQGAVAMVTPVLRWVRPWAAKALISVSIAAACCRRTLYQPGAARDPRHQARSRKSRPPLVHDISSELAIVSRRVAARPIGYIITVRCHQANRSEPAICRHGSVKQSRRVELPLVPSSPAGGVGARPCSSKPSLPLPVHSHCRLPVRAALLRLGEGLYRQPRAVTRRHGPG